MRRTQKARLAVECLEERALLSGVVTEVEFNGTRGRATAFTVPADGLIQLKGASVNDNDKDFFRFRAASTGTLNINVQTTNALFAKLQIEDAAGNKIFETEPKNGSNGGSANLKSGVTYFIRMRSPIASPAAYLVDLGFDKSVGGGGSGGSVVQETEVNDTDVLANAFNFDATGNATLEGRVSNQSDRDFFRFTAPRNGTVSINVRTSNGVVARMSVLTATGRVFESQPNDGINSGSFNVVAGVSYFVRMRTPSTLAAGYIVDLSLT